MKRSDPFLIAPTPHWARALTETSVQRLIAWRTEAAIVVRASTEHWRATFELTRGHLFDCRRVDTESRPPKRTTVPLDAALRGELLRFAQRLEWIDAVGDDTNYTPTATEDRLRDAARAMRSIGAPEDAADLRFDDTPDVGLFLDVIAGRWERVFTAIDEGAPRPRWTNLLLVALSGNIDALGRIVADANAGEDGSTTIEAILLGLAGHHDAAIERYRAAVEDLFGVRQANACLDVARLCRLRKRSEEGVAWARRALLIESDDSRLVSGAVAELVRCGALDDARSVLETYCAKWPAIEDTAVALAELLLWAGQTSEAERWLSPFLADNTDLRLLRAHGVRLALDARNDARLIEALTALERAQQVKPDDLETMLWRAEVNLRLGRREQAEQLVTVSRSRVQTPIHVLLHAALAGPDAIPHQSELAQLNQLLGEPMEPWLRDPLPAALNVLARFGGNRGEWLTERVAGGAEVKPLRLPRADSVLSSRDASADLLREVVTTPIPELERRFDALAEEYPESPHPLCYRGELDLWLGEYGRATERFEAALKRASARWGYVGRAAAAILVQDWAAADTALAECNAKYTPVRGATTHVYLGEMWRRRGDHERAILELEQAVAAKPGRVGAWINLALSRRALGQHKEANDIVDRLTALVPRLFWDAMRALGDEPRWPPPVERVGDVLVHALVMMRGNRSSHTITYFDAGGVMRVARPATQWRSVLAKQAPSVALGLRNRLAVGVP